VRYAGRVRPVRAKCQFRGRKIGDFDETTYLQATANRSAAFLAYLMQITVPLLLRAFISKSVLVNRTPTIMKKTTTHFALTLGLIALFAVVGVSRTMAYDHDDKGWFDNNHHHHPFIYHNHHRGYWDQQNGVRVFINV
jgi:hypothetical protein